MRGPHERSTPVPPLRRPRRARPLCPRRRSGESQPAGAVTQHPGAGEGQLGCTLVERGSRGVALTAHGRLVLEHARRLLAGHRALHNAVSQLGNLDSGELRLGGGPFPAARLLPRHWPVSPAPTHACASHCSSRTGRPCASACWMTPSNSSSPISASCKAIRSCASTRYASIPAYSSAAPAIRCWVWSGRAPGNWPITRWPARVCPRKSAATWRACCNATNRSAYSATMC